MERDGDMWKAPQRAVGKSKVRLVPDVYILPRRSIPKTIALYAFLTVAGVGAGMLVEQWIKVQVAIIAGTMCYINMVKEKLNL